ncbi:oxidoreductase, short-chain dehydrogenase/reductase family protein [Pseudooceanicola batsensis HTCC2597]|uniref:Oxidoreductase, short-chain dehydrogenase/reductase family protein n=1 Tax=Pseudooceanicola batsensis (strain ATCC BAA-863 / DSM 15984 / KCTC 12145 / HTCC2597) TaxID=252305 RepID=A3U1R1_PSEBH|nr:SDR family NAD(P)-dependent oxidoreductase [Pseudooceanicola batsensis]EAQ01845.1 oxidoreductase, short-chain dehydrogenase/reductase family protein [Pseudooceanicola batsensis HTCC2597]
MTDPIALVTGASRGLGAALAKALAPTHHIIAVARTVGALEELDDAIKAAGGSATLAPMDVTQADAMAQLCRSIHDRWGGVALWLHTAIHVPPLSPVPHIDAKDWARSVNTNVTAMGHLIPYVAPLLGTEGRAVFFEDAAATEKFHGAYGATKAAQIAMARVWAAECKASGPRVDVLTAAPMPTALRARFHPGEDRSALIHPDREAARLLGLLG